MNGDIAFRCAAVCLAVVLALAPYRRQIAEVASLAIQAAKARSATIARATAVLLLLAAAWGKLPTPSWPVAPAAPLSFPSIDAPSDTMKANVLPVADAFRSAPMSDRMLWAQLWNKAAVVVDGDAVMTEVVFTDTRSLRAFVVLALDIGWRRIGGNQAGKYSGLREATELAFSGVIGKDAVPVTPELRAKFAEICRALAWASLPPKG